MNQYIILCYNLTNIDNAFLMQYRLRDTTPATMRTYIRIKENIMEYNTDSCQTDKPTAETMFITELFSKLPVLAQEAIIDLIKSLLSAE